MKHKIVFVYFALFAYLALLAVGIFPIRIFLVNGYSMLPTLKPLDMVLCISDNVVKIGDIYVVEIDGKTIVHRLVWRGNGMIMTKGDNNPSPDKPVPESNIVCHVVLVIPSTVWIPVGTLFLIPFIRRFAKTLKKRVVLALAPSIAVMFSTMVAVATLIAVPIPPISSFVERPFATVVKSYLAPNGTLFLVVDVDGEIVNGFCTVNGYHVPTYVIGEKVVMYLPETVMLSIVYNRNCVAIVKCWLHIVWRNHNYVYNFKLYLPIPMGRPIFSVAEVDDRLVVSVSTKNCLPVPIKINAPGIGIVNATIGCGIIDVPGRVQGDFIRIDYLVCGTKRVTFQRVWR